MSLWQTEFTSGYMRAKHAKDSCFSYAEIIANPEQHPCRTVLVLTFFLAPAINHERTAVNFSVAET